MKRIPKLGSTLRAALAAMTVAIALSGCATSGIEKASGGPVGNPYIAFINGEARLTCGVSCSGAGGAARRTEKTFYDTGRWRDLAFEVMRVGFHGDRNYFYLGVAAEGLGYRDAALTYYRIALSGGGYKCDGLFNNCDGFVFPRDISARVKAIEDQLKTEAAQKATREAAARYAREVAERSRMATEKSARETAERSARETAEKSAREAADRLARDARVAAEADERERAASQTRSKPKPKVERVESTPNPKSSTQSSTPQGAESTSATEGKSKQEPLSVDEKVKIPIKARSAMDL